MPATAIPMLKENSILCWEKETTFKTAPAAATWRSFGKVTEWNDLGPQQAVFRDLISGSGVEAHQIGFEGTTYQDTLGPFQVVDPLVLGFWWGKETARAASGATGFFRHTLAPTDLGLPPSMGVQMRDRQVGSPTRTDKTTYLGTLVKRLSLRGEEVADDGSGGRLMAALDLVAHDDDETVADKAVTLPAATPYRYSHGRLTLWGEQVFRVETFEWSGDRQNRYNFYWRDDNTQKPAEAPPEGALYDFNAVIVADGEQFTTGGGVDKFIRQIARERLLGDATLRFIRTLDQDEFQLNLVDLALVGAPKHRTTGKVRYRVRGHARTSTMQYVDDQNTAYFPT